MGIKQQLIDIADQVFRFDANSLLKPSNDIASLLKNKQDRNHIRDLDAMKRAKLK